MVKYTGIVYYMCYSATTTSPFCSEASNKCTDSVLHLKKFCWAAEIVVHIPYIYVVVLVYSIFFVPKIGSAWILKRMQIVVVVVIVVALLLFNPLRDLKP